MTQRIQSSGFLRHRKRNRWSDKRERQLLKLSNWRAAKKRKHEQAIRDGWTPEPKFTRWFPLEFGVRRKSDGETHWHDLKSVRHAAKALGLILKFCQ
jgi:hypothetical protein